MKESIAELRDEPDALTDIKEGSDADCLYLPIKVNSGAGLSKLL